MTEPYFDLRDDLGEVSASMDVTAPEYLLFDKDGNGTLPRGNIITISAKYKQGKSFLCAIMCASVLGCEKFYRTNLAPNVVYYLDTEQDVTDSQMLLRRVHRLMGWDERTNTQRFRVFNLRDKSVDERKVILDCIFADEALFKPSLVIIDGIADINHNFNDLTESEDTIAHLMRLSKENNCAIVCVLHENKGKDDDNPQGFLGTLLMKKSSDLFKVTKSGEGKDVTFTIEHRLSRHRTINPLRFGLMVEEQAKDKVTPCVASADVMTDAEERAEQKRVRLFGMMQKAFNASGKDILTYTELSTIIMNQNGKKIRTANTYVAEALAFGLLVNELDGRYKLA